MAIDELSRLKRVADKERYPGFWKDRCGGKSSEGKTESQESETGAYTSDSKTAPAEQAE